MNVDELQRRVDQAAQVAGPEPLFPHLDLQHMVPHLRLHQVVEPRPAWAPRTAYERVWARINAVVRRIAAHAVEPAVMQQNESNAALLAVLEQMIAADAALCAAVSVARMRGSQGEAGARPYSDGAPASSASS
jgi:hypothetical protein